tara:strand:+ start:520 stop:2610 length:2091 start_codon:yes stop_codon:yes gene_type:complete
MRVPTYEAQRAIPRSGGRQFSTAQISGAALGAPARALAERGQALSQFGQEITRFGLKKIQVGADNEAAEASAMLGVELQQLSSELLQTPNMANADKVYAEKSRLLVDKFKSGLSGSMARDAFTRRARQIEFNNRVDFSRRNNERVVQQREVLLDRDTTTFIEIASNPLLSVSGRAVAVQNQLDALTEAEADFGPAKIEKKRNKFFERLARSTLANTVQKGADINDTIEGFQSGNSQDPILNAARDNLTQEQVNKLVKETVSTAKSQRSIQDKEEKRLRELAQTNFDANLQGLVQQFNLEENMASEETSTKFMLQTDEMMQNTLDAYEGTDDSKAELSMNLQKLRTKHSLKIGDLRRKAQLQNAQRQIGSDLRGLVVDVTKNPTFLPQGLDLLDQTISESGSKFLNTDQEELAREGGRQDLIEAALDGYIANAQIKDARELFNTPGIAVALDPSAQENYRRQFIKYDEDQNKSLLEDQRKIRNAEIIFGRPLTMSEKAEALGFKFGQRGGAFKDESSLRKEFMKGSEDFVAVRDAFNKVQIAGQNVSAPGDLALIFNFMKMLDPGSVVRESEFRTAAFAASIPERFKASYNRVVKGTTLGPEARQEFVAEAGRILEAQTKTQRGREQQYTELATTYGFEPANVVLSQIQLGAPQQEQRTSTTGAEPTTTDGTLPDAPVAPPKKLFRLDALGQETPSQ